MIYKEAYVARKGVSLLDHGVVKRMAWFFYYVMIFLLNFFMYYIGFFLATFTGYLSGSDVILFLTRIFVQVVPFSLFFLPLFLNWMEGKKNREKLKDIRDDKFLEKKYEEKM